MGMPPLVEAMRPQQWVKNGFVLAPLLFSKRADEPALIAAAIGAFLAFALSSSCIYLINDILDREQDRCHPEKCNRPVASRRLSVGAAWIGAAFCCALGLGLAFSIASKLGLIVLVYVALQVGYGVVLKHVVIIDVMVVAVGFVLRVLAGAAAVSVVASEWLILCTLLLALFLGFSKRRHELITLGEDSSGHRRVLSDYSLALLDQINSVLLGATIVCYAIYTVSPRTQGEVAKSDELVYSVPIVIYGLLRYLHIVHKGRYSGSPTAALLKDRPLLLCVVVWVLFCSFVLYRAR